MCSFKITRKLSLVSTNILVDSLLFFSTCLILLLVFVMAMHNKNYSSDILTCMSWIYKAQEEMIGILSQLSS